MTLKFNPFRPGAIISPGMFVGRAAELKALEGALFQTANGNPKHFLIQGERGIGKSSLLLFLELVAKGEIKKELGFKFLTLSVIADPKDTLASLIGKTAREFKKKANKFGLAKENLKRVLEFVSRFEAAGVKYKAPSAEDADSIEELADAIESFISDAGTKCSGVVLLIDEADNAAKADLGVFCKTLTERLSRTADNRFCLGLAGLPPVLDVLKDSHESAPRIFETRELATLSAKECGLVIDAGLAEIKTKTNTTVTFDALARDALSDLSDGYPHFIQQLAFSAVAADSDNVVDIHDFNLGCFGKDVSDQSSAIRQLGAKYFAAPVLEEIYSKDYRTILLTMAERLDGWVTRSELLEKSKVRETQLNNALTVLKKKNLVVAKKGEKGTYRLPTKSLAVWIRAVLSATKMKVVEAAGA